MSQTRSLPLNLRVPIVPPASSAGQSRFRLCRRLTAGLQKAGHERQPFDLAVGGFLGFVGVSVANEDYRFVGFSPDLGLLVTPRAASLSSLGRPPPPREDLVDFSSSPRDRRRAFRDDRRCWGQPFHEPDRCGAVWKSRRPRQIAVRGVGLMQHRPRRVRPKAHDHSVVSRIAQVGERQIGRLPFGAPL